jgi:hypothetical protein
MTCVGTVLAADVSGIRDVVKVGESIEDNEAGTSVVNSDTDSKTDETTVSGSPVEIGSSVPCIEVKEDATEPRAEVKGDTSVVGAPIDISVVVGRLKVDSGVPNIIVDSLEKILLEDGDTVESICGISVDSKA